jgi:hypothetical protein
MCPENEFLYRFYHLSETICGLLQSIPEFGRRDKGKSLKHVTLASLQVTYPGPAAAAHSTNPNILSHRPAPRLNYFINNM